MISYPSNLLSFLVRNPALKSGYKLSLQGLHLVRALAILCSLLSPTARFPTQMITLTGSNVGFDLKASARLNAAKVVLAAHSLEKGEVAKDSVISPEKRCPDRLEL